MAKKILAWGTMTVLLSLVASFFIVVYPREITEQLFITFGILTFLIGLFHLAIWSLKEIMK